MLKIYSVSHDFICEHRISAEKGVLVKNVNHNRDTSSTVDKIQQELDEFLEHKAIDFLVGIRADKPRYARDQFRIVQSLIDQYGKEPVLKAASFCAENKLFSAHTARDFLAVMNADTVRTTDFPHKNDIPVERPEYHVSVEKRPVEVYAKAGEST